jgi:flagellar assembly factor FliW
VPTILTKPFGTIELNERQRIHFPFGVLGFESLHDYALLDAAQAPFYWLQSLEVVEIAFVLIEPRVFRPDYALAVAPDELADLGILKPEDALVFAIVTIPDDPRQMTANLQGPLIINKENRTGRQAISGDPRWQVRHPILAELVRDK